MTANLSGSWLHQNVLAFLSDLESFDPDLLRRYRKTQNLSKRYNVIDDIAYAESLGISITYGYLFDPRHQKAADMERPDLRDCGKPVDTDADLHERRRAACRAPRPFGTIWSRAASRPNLRLRDLDGETIAYSQLGDRPEAIVDFVERMFRRPWTVVGRAGIILQDPSSPGEGGGR